MNVFSAFREQILGDIKTRVDEAASRMDLVPREDFERLEPQVTPLQKKIDAMEGKKPAAAMPKKAPSKKKPAQGKNKGKKK